MTYEDVKRIRENPRASCCDIKELQRLIDEALEKQIPKRKHKYQGYRCVCGEEVAKNQTYCEFCGQKLLDWSETE